MSSKIILEEDGETIRIENLTIKNREIYSFLDELEDNEREQSIDSALKIGITGLKRISTSAEVDYVEKEFERVTNKIDEMFNPDNRSSYLGQLEETLEDYFEEGGTVEDIFDPTDKSKPIGKLKDELIDELQDIRDKVAGEEAVEDLKEKTPLKGEEFEDYCERFLGEIVCSNLGDELLKTGERIGEITNCKKGDFVVKPNGLDGKKIVFEMKSGSISQRKILEEELPEAMKNRMADYGILVSKHVENLPNKIGWFNEYRGNMLVCAIGSKEKDEYIPKILNVAYQYARQRLLQEETKEAEVDVGAIKNGMEKINQKLGKLSKLKRKTTNIESATGEIREIVDKVRDEIEQELEEMSESLSFD